MQTYQRWREVQNNLKEEDTEKLKKKISLQLQLIRQQHALAEHRRFEEEEAAKQVRPNFHPPVPTCKIQNCKHCPV